MADLSALSDAVINGDQNTAVEITRAAIEQDQGAEKILKSVELCIIEFGCLDAYVDRTTSRQLMDIMYDNGFCLYDIVDLRYRPYDGALAGGDFFFIKTSSKLKAHKDYF